MPSTLTRRNLLGGSLVAAGAVAAETSRDVPFPLVDYHAHLSPQLTIEHAVELAKERNLKFGVVEHPGPRQRIQTDADLERYIANLRKYPVYVGIQPIYPGWSAPFSKALVNQLDYVLMDALTLPEEKGGWWEIWRPDTFVEDPDAFMTKYFDFVVKLLSTERIDIFAWPTFLPVCIARDYPRLWTKRRREQVVEVAKAKGIAIELNAVARVPDEEFVLMAKSAGLKFSFGTDARNDNAGKLRFCIDLARRCGLTARHMFTPKPQRA